MFHLFVINVSVSVIYFRSCSKLYTCWCISTIYRFIHSLHFDSLFLWGFWRVLEAWSTYNYSWSKQHFIWHKWVWKKCCFAWDGGCKKKKNPLNVENGSCAHVWFMVGRNGEYAKSDMLTREDAFDNTWDPILIFFQCNYCCYCLAFVKRHAV